MSNGKPTPGPWVVRHDYNIFAGNRSVANAGGYSSNGPNELDIVEQNKANARLIASAPDLLALAKLVAQDYEDAADWKDARGKLVSVARAALDKAGVVEDAPEDEDDYNPHWPFK